MPSRQVKASASQGETCRVLAKWRKSPFLRSNQGVGEAATAGKARQWLLSAGGH
jgi:hypothetical protein